ncbi:MAG TPA: DUF2399 domain-containing protein [Rhodocyclaceae bacterium]|nr:DUF2399 domain-containing protein [Rhodocyclaceae bacterium]
MLVQQRERIYSTTARIVATIGRRIRQSPIHAIDDAAVSALWDDTLAGAMLAERLAIDEEGLADVLLDDLRHC